MNPFDALIEYLEMGSCQLDTRVVNPRNGYVMVRLSNPRRMSSAHRVALETRLGRSLDRSEQAGHRCHDVAAWAGLCPGGLCEHRRCANPDHLVVQTSRENSMASPHTHLGRALRAAS